MKLLLLTRMWFVLATVLCVGCATTQRVTIHSIPAEATLLIDRGEKGVTPREVVLVKKTHRIELRKQGYEPFQGYIAPRPRSLLTHLFSLGFTLYDPDVLESSYTFRLKKAAQSEE